jgi:hypothetical protein
LGVVGTLAFLSFAEIIRGEDADARNRVRIGLLSLEL